MMALADRGPSHRGSNTQNIIVVQSNNHRPAANSNVVDIRNQSHRHQVGQRLNQKDVVVVQNWRTRGLPQPRRGEVYVIDGDSIYLVGAATLLIKALVD